MATIKPKERSPNEKLIETLFNRFALAAFPPGHVWIYTPTTWEEHRAGYDASLTGPRCRQLLLQFKRPRLTVSGYSSFSPRPQQHERLRHYPPGTAFYVVPVLRTLEQMQAAQKSGCAPLDFLRNYLAIDISTLPLDFRFVRYGISEIWVTAQVGKERRHIHAGKWIQGNTLIEKFMAGRLGTTIDAASRTLSMAPGEEVADTASPATTSRPIDEVTQGGANNKPISGLTILRAIAQ